jgi:hypothetical protein
MRARAIFPEGPVARGFFERLAYGQGDFVHSNKSPAAASTPARISSTWRSAGSESSLPTIDY